MWVRWVKSLNVAKCTKALKYRVLAPFESGSFQIKGVPRGASSICTCSRSREIPKSVIFLLKLSFYAFHNILNRILPKNLGSTFLSLASVVFNTISAKRRHRYRDLKFLRLIGSLCKKKFIAFGLKSVQPYRSYAHQKFRKNAL